MEPSDRTDVRYEPLDRISVPLCLLKSLLYLQTGTIIVTNWVTGRTMYSFRGKE